jgi:hypothetical protein
MLDVSLILLAPFQLFIEHAEPFLANLNPEIKRFPQIRTVAMV